MKTEITNSLMCDPITGVCEVPQLAEATINQKTSRPVKLVFFTDPICSSCWGIEPQMRKLQQEYGDYFEVEYRMGGLLQSWSTYGGTDVSGPQSVAQHWDEASQHYGMPIDGAVWLKDPLSSSYPPSVAVKAAQLQDVQKGEKLLRRLKEMVFVEKKNITRWEVIAEAALYAGLELVQLQKDFHGAAKDLFEEDLALKKNLGVRGFPTIFFTDEEGNQFKVYGSKPYETYEQALLKLVPNAVKSKTPKSYETVFNCYDSVTTKEFAVLTNKSTAEATIILEYLQQQGRLEKIEIKNGALWRKI